MLILLSELHANFVSLEESGKGCGKILLGSKYPAIESTTPTSLQDSRSAGELLAQQLAIHE